MTHYKVNAETCYSIFTKAESSVSPAQSAHSSIRSGVSAGRPVRQGRGHPDHVGVAGSLQSGSTQNMTTAEQRVTKAVAGESGAVAAIQEGDEIMANRSQASAKNVGEVRITDGFER